MAPIDEYCNANHKERTPDGHSANWSPRRPRGEQWHSRIGSQQLTLELVIICYHPHRAAFHQPRFMSDAARSQEGHSLAGVRVALLGRLNGMSRRDAQRLIRQHGGVALDKADATANLLVVGDES